MAIQWDETMLMAYVDGELEVEAARALAAAIRDDAEAQTLVNLFRTSAAQARPAFDGSLAAPIPERLVAALKAPKTNEPSRKSATIVPFVPGSSRLGGSLRQMWLPLAASAVGLIIGLTAERLWPGAPASGTLRPAAGDGGPIAAQRLQTALIQALDGAKIGETVTYTIPNPERTGRITVTGAVKADFSALCRSFRHTPADAADPATGGIACRSDDGTWSVLTIPLP